MMFFSVLLTLASIIAAHNEVVADDACLQIARSYDIWTKSGGHGDFSNIPGQTAYDCLMSMPVDFERAVKFLDEYLKYLQFQSTLDSLKHPPSGYKTPSIDLLKGFDKIRQKAEKSIYKSQYEFDNDIKSLIHRANEGHLEINLCSQQIFHFQRSPPLVSISSDGLELPKIYTWNDAKLLISGFPNTQVSHLVEINSISTAYFLQAHLARTFQYHDPDARYNHLFPSPVNQYTGLFTGGGWQSYQGLWPGAAHYLLKFHNGTTMQVNTTVTWPATNGPMNYTDGQTLFKAACLPDYAPSLSSFSHSPIAPPQQQLHSNDNGPPPSTEGIYPTPIIRTHQNSLRGYYLNTTNHNDTAVLQIPTFQHTAGINFSQTAQDFLTRAAEQDGKTKLILDLSGNPGGDVIPGLNIFSILFPDLKIRTATRFRATELVKLVGKVYSEVYSTKDGLKEEEEEEVPIDPPFVASVVVRPDQKGRFTGGWEEVFGPELASTETDPVFGYGAFKGVSKGGRKRPFKAEDIVVMTNGECASTCALLISLLRRQGKVRTLVFGGRPRHAPMQAVGGVKGGQYWSLTTIYRHVSRAVELAMSKGTSTSTTILTEEELQRLKELAPADPDPRAAVGTGGFPLRMGWKGEGGVNFRDLYYLEDGDDDEVSGVEKGKWMSTGTVPAQFIYEPAECRRFFTVEMMFRPAKMWEVAREVMFGSGSLVLRRYLRKRRRKKRKKIGIWGRRGRLLYFRRGVAPVRRGLHEMVLVCKLYISQVTDYRRLPPVGGQSYVSSAGGVVVAPNFPFAMDDRDVGSSSLIAEDLDEEEEADLVIHPSELGSESDAFIKENNRRSSSPTSPLDVGTNHDREDAEVGHLPTEDDEVIDPRLRNYPIPLVAKTVDLHNDETEPLLTIRFWILSTLWVIIGCSVSSVYYFKPYSVRLSGYVVQLLSWGMGALMARHFPQKQFTLTLPILQKEIAFNLNPGPWNPKEHALVIVAYWGSTYTAYGLGPLSAMELYYHKRMSRSWAVLFLMTTQLMGYGFAGLYRDVLVRPPGMYYPGVLPNVTLFNAMHRHPSVTKKSLGFFGVVAAAAFVYQWLPGFVMPLLASLPVVCWVGLGKKAAFVLGSGTYGFGLLDFSLDWNYASFLTPLYTPLWATVNRFVGAAVVIWVVYPLAYFLNVNGAQQFAPMSSGTWDAEGNRYNISRILTPTYQLNRTALEEYSPPYWSFSYAMHFFWGFAASTAVLTYAVMFHGRQSWETLRSSLQTISNPFAKKDHKQKKKNVQHRAEFDDPYLKLTAHLPRVPHWWYLALLLFCLVIAIAQLSGGDMQLPWWGLLLITAISALFTFPSGILFGFTNVQIGMDYLSELLAGFLFPGKPIAVLTCTVYGRQILEQCLNLVSDIKFGFYMKIPERELFVAQVYGTLLGPFVNWACMRLIIDTQGPKLMREVMSGTTWNALKTKNFFSLSVIWGVLGPQVFFGGESPYRWVYWGFVVGPLAVMLLWLVQHRLARPKWGKVASVVNPVVMLNGATLFPIYPTTNLTTSALVAVVFMGYAYRYHPVWFRKYNYLLGAGLDCGAQLVQMAMILVVDLPNVTMPHWWGNDAVAVDKCYPV
ncbi:OPT oligopeptide transporter protein-domain-containing protein [Neurospora hispaniola]|uniref:OPT oligopeptide transporter protein-domain-containing protein n=1 Tax=Neurospora hispaniola TaxID=588809 RepID=A0AAJ0I149_9PEZI|nr:OPT oligopeptide transporter protein-domain-containing protein [Neurospora hispaniola]